jgi:hypothetical protein
VLSCKLPAALQHLKLPAAAALCHSVTGVAVLEFAAGKVGELDCYMPVRLMTLFVAAKAVELEGLFQLLVHDCCLSPSSSAIGPMLHEVALMCSFQT